jgi:hypothetical protein
MANYGKMIKSNRQNQQKWAVTLWCMFQFSVQQQHLYLHSLAIVYSLYPDVTGVERHWPSVDAGED